MKHVYLALVLLFGTSISSVAQNTVEVDASAEQLGYANVFELPANGGGFVFGDFWGVPDLKTVVDAGAGTITLQPNFNTWDPNDPFWVVNGEGNKTFEGNTFLEDNSTLIGSPLTFVGGCVANTISSDYDVVAFIKVFNADFSVLKEETSALVEGENFSVEYTNVEAEDAVVQYGFKVTGPNANPADEAALGSVVVSEQLALSVGDNKALQVSVYPNPTKSVWNINTANSQITKVAIYDIAGKLIEQTSATSNTVQINSAAYQAGIYMANVETETGTKIVRLIKQ